MRAPGAALLALAAAACAGPGPEALRLPPPEPLARPQAAPARSAAPRPFVRVERARGRAADLPVTVHLKGASLTECLARAEPTLNVVPATPGVDFSRRYDVRVHALTLAQYLDILEGITGYALELDPEQPIVYVASYVTRSWDVSTFASHGQARLSVGANVALSTGSGGGEEEGGGGREAAGGAAVSYDHSDNPWDDLLANARTILHLDAAAEPPAAALTLPDFALPDAAGGDIPRPAAAPGGAESWLVADRRLGLLRARGPAARIAELDAWLSEQIRRGARQVLLAVAILDVTREEGDSSGLDLSLLYSKADERVRLARRAPSGLSLGVPSGAWEVEAALEFGRWTLGAMVRQLAAQGEVTVRSDPVFTVVNGMTTFLGDGEEVSFIANTDLVLGESSGNNVLSTEFEHIRVGFRIAVTPRVRGDGSILVEVVPVLSSIRSQSEFRTGVSTIVRPNIAIQELATLAITRSGKPILLGGLIQSRALEQAQRPPCEHFLCDALAAATLERSSRELMIVITPIEVAI